MVAKVILNKNTRATDYIYDYLIPEDMDLHIGMRVVVPFGNGNKTTEGYIVGTSENTEFENLKSIIKAVDDFIYFDESSVKMVEFIHHRYFCQYSEAIKLLLPPNVNTKFTTYYSFNQANHDINAEEISGSVLLEKIVSAISDAGKMTFEELSAITKSRSLHTALNRLTELGVITKTTVHNENIKDAEITVIKPSMDKDELYIVADKIRKRAPKQASVVETVCDYGAIHLTKLLEICDTTHGTVNTLVEKGYIFADKEVVRNDISGFDKIDLVEKPVLTAQQQVIVDKISEDISENNHSAYLLHGVTGSGKTEVYLNLIEKCISNGKNAIFLVPEISLTPQMIRQVVGRFGENVAVLHSSLTARERYDQWKKIKCNEVNVVVGARSAVFAPFENIGLIIIDEEHESSYKSEMSPKYNTIEIARYRAKQCNSTLLLASATPSVETYYLAKTGKIKLLELKNRINNAQMPETHIVDMRAELKSGNTSILSTKLQEEIAYNLRNRFKTILFLNRRGYSGFIQCRGCGYVMQCPNCNISMTYHKSIRSLVCHYCDYKTPLFNICPECGSTHIKFSSDGTQKVEDEISSIFPEAKILRMDADTTASRNAHESILAEFHKEESDILIGTQMITKGLDFEKVTLVGVLAADMSLHTDDFRSDEKTFDLITQVCGRAGRGKYGGKAIIQAYDPENETVQFSKNLDYINFYEREIEVRRLLVYPPFCEIMNFIFSSEDDLAARDGAMLFQSMLKDNLSNSGYLNHVVAYRVVPAPLQRVNGKFRYRFIMKLNYSKAVYDIIHKTAEVYRKTKNTAGLSVDVNPYNMS